MRRRGEPAREGSRRDHQGGPARRGSHQATARVQPSAGAARRAARCERADHRHDRHARPADRRAHRGRAGAGARSLAGARGSRPAGAGRDEPRGQRERRHAGRREPDDRNDGRRARELVLPRGGGRARAVRDARHHRHRQRDDQGDAAAPVRAVLHDQGNRERHRPRPVDDLRHRQAEQRLHLGVQRTRPRHDVQGLPAALEPRRRRSRSCSPAVAAPARRASETVLLVEDEAGVRQLSKRILDNAGYRVLEAANGDDAERIFAQHARARSIWS